MNVEVQIPLQDPSSSSLDCIPRNGIAGYRITLLSLWHLSVVVSIAATPVFITTHPSLFTQNISSYFCGRTLLLESRSSSSLSTPMFLTACGRGGDIQLHLDTTSRLGGLVRKRWL